MFIYGDLGLIIPDLIFRTHAKWVEVVDGIRLARKYPSGIRKQGFF